MNKSTLSLIIRSKELCEEITISKELNLGFRSLTLLIAEASLISMIVTWIPYNLPLKEVLMVELRDSLISSGSTDQTSTCVVWHS